MGKLINLAERRAEKSGKREVWDVETAYVPTEELSLRERLERIKQSIARINALMAQLREVAEEDKKGVDR